MSEIIDVVAVVDVEGLLGRYPSGIGYYPDIEGLPKIGEYFTLLVPRGNSYDDPEETEYTGISCNVGDVIRFRSVPKSLTSRGVIIDQFSDKEGSTKYLHRPSFMTSEPSGLKYDAGSNNSSLMTYRGWDIWSQKVVEAETPDSFVSLTALKSTKGLEYDHIRYLLGFAAKVGRNVIRWNFDPAIRIED